jgi:hypothetical protein
MSVKAFVRPNFGGHVSLQEAVCSHCGVNYLIAAGKIVLNRIDSKKARLHSIL